jgi:uncharacterized protein YciI
MIRSLILPTLFFSFILFLNNCSYNSTEEVKTELSPEINSDSIVFDAALAERLGADENGMKKYVLAYLKSGPNRTQNSIESANIQRGHLENITRMVNEGTLVVAGPFLDDGDIRGIYIFNVETVEEARVLTATDPAIQAGRLEMELHPWYGPAALIMVKGISEKIVQE